METQENSPKHDPYLALRQKEFQFFLFSRFFLTIGVQIIAVVVGWQIYKITHDPLSLGLIGLAEAIPSLVVALYAGHIADKVNRKKILLWCNMILVLCAGLMVLFTTPSVNIIELYGTSPLYAVIFIMGIARGFFGPAIFALLAQIVPREGYANAAAWNSTNWHIAAVAGPALGGLLYGFAGIHFTYIISTLAIGMGLVLMWLIKSKPLNKIEEKISLRESIMSGVRFVFSNQIVLGAMSLDLFAVLFGGAVALLPIFADKILHCGPEGLGFLRAAPAAGAVVMALIMAHRGNMKNAGKNLLACVAGFGICMILFAISTNFWFSLFVLFISGVFDNVSVVIRSTIVQLKTPDHMRGRVSAVNNIFIGSSNELGSLESGVAAKLMGTVTSVIFGGCMTLIVVGTTYFKAPKLRNLDMTKV